MKGCFDMIEDNIAILLKDNGKISYISRDKLSGNVRKKLKKKNVKFLLIPVGIFTPEYVVIDINDVMKKFGVLDMDYSLSVLSNKVLDYENFNGSSTLDSKRSIFNITNYADFISVIYSLIRISTFNHIYNSLSNTFTLGLNERFLILSNVVIKYRIDAICNTSDKDLVKVSESNIIELIEDVIGDDSLKNQLTSSAKISRGSQKRIIIDFANGEWFMGTRKEMTDEMVIGCPLSWYNSMVFISYKDYENLSLVEGGTVTLVGFDSASSIRDVSFEELVYILGLEEPFSVDVIEQRPDIFFIEEKAVDAIYTSNDILAYASELPNLMMTYDLLLKIVGENEFSGLTAEIVLFPNKENIDMRCYCQLDPFIFNINNIIKDNDTSENTDSLSEFFNAYNVYVDRIRDL